MKIKRSWILIIRKITYKNIIYRLQRLFLSQKRSPFFCCFGAFLLAAAIFFATTQEFSHGAPIIQNEAICTELAI